MIKAKSIELENKQKGGLISKVKIFVFKSPTKKTNPWQPCAKGKKHESVKLEMKGDVIIA